MSDAGHLGAQLTFPTSLCSPPLFSRSTWPHVAWSKPQASPWSPDASLMVLKQGRLDSRQSPQPPGQGAPGAPRGPGREGPCPCSVCRSPTQHASSHRQLLLEGKPQTEDRMGARGTGARRGVQRRGQLSQAVRPATVTRNQSPWWRHRPRRRVQGNLGDAKISADTRLASREKPRAWGSARRPQLGSIWPALLGST